MMSSAPSRSEHETHADHVAAQLEKLARMAGQISDFFKAYPEDQAVAAIADHINQFWSGSMRQKFLDGFTAQSPELSPLLRKALSAIRPRRSQTMM